MVLETTIIFSRLKCFALYIFFICLMKHQKEAEASKTKNIIKKHALNHTDRIENEISLDRQAP